MYKSVEKILQELPERMADDVSGYVRSVSAALPRILERARIARTPSLAEEVAFIAAVKKIFSIVSSTSSILESSLGSLGTRASEVRIGSQVYSPVSREYRELRELDQTLKDLLRLHNLLDLVEEGDYSEIALQLSHGR
jgi:hypothetical protein